MVTTQAVSESVLADLESTNRNDFDRLAIPAVAAFYHDFMVRGDKYPYLQTVVSEFAAHYGIAVSVHRDTVPSPERDMHLRIEHEVYLASRQWRVREMRQQESDARFKGYVAITELELVDGAKFERQKDGKTYRMVPGFGYGGTTWAALPARARTRGLDLTELVRRHNAYLAACERGYVESDGPAVVMVKAVSK